MQRNRLKFYFRPCLLFVFLTILSGNLSAQLQADFTMDQTGGCAPLVVKFTNRTSGASASAVYNWDFGNGNSSSYPDGGAIYNATQTYIVTLTVTDGPNKSSKSSQVAVYKNPTIDFSASVAKGCLPLPVTFTASGDPGSGSFNSYAWDFGDGNVQQGYSASQTHIYSVVQDPMVSLTATNSYGCHTTIQKNGLVDVIPALIPAISADKNFLCLITDPVQFSNYSAGPGTLSYAWDFGDGNVSTQKNPQYIFNKKGIYTVKLKVTSSEGCVATTTLSNTLNVASYTTDFNVPSPICDGSYYSFTNSGSPAPDNSVWNYDGYPVSYSANTGLSASAPGIHVMSLTNTFGACTQTTTHNITVNSLPTPVGFTYAAQGKCGAPEEVIFTDISNATKQEWDFRYNIYSQAVISSTAKQPSYKYNDQGPYDVWLRSSNASGCSVTSYQYIYLPPPSVNIYSSSPAYTCVTPNTQNFTVSTSGFSSFLWHFGDGTTSSTQLSPTHIYTLPGDYLVSLTYTTTDGCTGTSNTLTVGVASMPVINITASSTTVCGNGQVDFHSGVTNSNTWTWYTWDFGDGTGNTYWGLDQTHFYSAGGKYSVSLTVSNLACTATATKTDFITILPPFLSYVGHTNTCEGDRGDIVFNESATGATSLLWDFGDGSTQTTAGDITSLTHHYVNDGVFPISVKATNDQSHCTLTSNADQVVMLHKQNPALTADKSVICTSDIIKDTIKYIMAPGPIYQYSGFWTRFEYGDGTPFTGNVQSPYIVWWNEYDGSLSQFSIGQTKIRAITTSTYFGCIDTSNFIPLKLKGVKAAFDIVQDHQCYQSPVILKDASIADGGNSIVSWSWDFSDGTLLKTGGTVSHNYAHPGNYYVQLTVKDAAGCFATTTDYSTAVISANGPEAVFNTSGNNVSLNSTVYFYNYTNTYGSYNTVYSWLISDGTSSTDYSISHTFPVAGDYTVTLTSKDAITGCSSSTSQVIHVSNFNTAFNFSKSFVSGACPPALVNFNNTSVNFSNVKWDFGDGFTADNLNYASHIYKDPGKYIVTLTVYAPNGLSDQIIDSVIIKTPTASLISNPLEACIGGIVKDTAISQNATSFTWDFGDGFVTNSNTPSATHQYGYSGVFDPKLMITDANGCNTGVNMNGEINIHPNPDISISPDNAVICQGAHTVLVGTGGITYKWTPAAGLDNDGISAPTASPAITTTYSLEIGDELGCKNSASVNVTVINPGKLKVNNDTTVCEGNLVQLNASGKLLYVWINDTDGLDNTGINNPKANPGTTTIYTVSGVDANNCFPETASITVRVLPLPIVHAGQDTTVQSGASFTMQGAGSSDIIQWNWTPEKYLSCSDCASPVCTIRETTKYTLKATSDNGCTATSSVVVKMECDEAKVSIPNAFTPNRDGKNDLFVIRGISIVKHIVIFDRWGDKVFERNNFSPADPASCWDGTFRGMEVPTGTYVYFAEMECPSGGAFSRKGSVVLFR